MLHRYFLSALLLSSAYGFQPAPRVPVLPTRTVSSPLFASVAEPLKETVAKAVGAPIPKEVHISLLETPPAAYQILAENGKENASMSKLKTFVAGMLGGAYVGMGGMLSLAIAGNLGSITQTNPGFARLVFAFLFPVNLLLSVQAGGQLCTGNTSKLTAAVCEGKIKLRQIFKPLGISFAGNFIACVAFAFLCKYSGVLSGGAADLAVSSLISKTSQDFGPILVKAMLCNWLVCLAIFLSKQAKDMTGKYVSILLPISTFDAIGFEHSVANMFLLTAGLLCIGGGTVTVWDALFKNLLPVIIGNFISGALMVGVLFSYLFGKLGEGK